MAHLPPSRLAALPGYDTAPDIYETPDLAEPTTTTTATTSPSASEDDSATSNSEVSDADEESESGVTRRRINIGKSRRRFDFQGRGVRTKGVDLGDRVDGGRKGYGLRYTGVKENESLEAKIARLRREVEECKVLAEKEGGDGETAGLDDLLESLDAVDTVDRTVLPTRESDILTPDTGADGAHLSEAQILQRVADFDGRLSGLESALGLSSLDATTIDGNEGMPLLPSLALLEQQLSTLSAASSIANLEAVSGRLLKLRSDADNALFQPSVNGTADTDDEVEAPSLTAADRETLSKLYALLPTLQSLSPTVPALLTRLRSLRTPHNNAADAASALEDVEKRQAEMDRELQLWRDGLEKVEDAVKVADAANGKNGRMVEGWVKDLEGRMKALGR